MVQVFDFQGSLIAVLPENEYPKPLGAFPPLRANSYHRPAEAPTIGSEVCVFLASTANYDTVRE